MKSTTMKEIPSNTDHQPVKKKKRQYTTPKTRTMIKRKNDSDEHLPDLSLNPADEEDQQRCKAMILARESYPKMSIVLQTLESVKIDTLALKPTKYT